MTAMRSCQPLPSLSKFSPVPPSLDPSVPPRRFVYKDMFERLRTVGVNPDDLQLAWDFTTASRDNNVSAMVHMRDEGLARVDAAAPGYTIDSVETEGLSDSIAYRLKGYIDAPLYLDNFDPGATLLRDASGLPVLNESTPHTPARLRGHHPQERTRRASCAAAIRTRTVGAPNTDRVGALCDVHERVQLHYVSRSISRAWPAKMKFGSATRW